MSIEDIHVTEPTFTRGDYHTGSSLEVLITYFRICPFGHSVGDRTHTVDIGSEFFKSDQPLTHHLESLCPTCGVKFGLTKDDYARIVKAIPKVKIKEK